MTTCGRCAATTPGTSLCSRCVARLEETLTTIGDYAPQLDVIAARQTRMTGEPGSRVIGAAVPLPVDLRFLSKPLDDRGRATRGDAPGRALRDEVQVELVGWARQLRDDRPGCDLPPWRRTRDNGTSCALLPVRGDQPTVLAAHLAGHARTIATLAWAPDLLAGALGLVHKLERMIDRPPERWYAGKCSARAAGDPEGVWCQVDLYVEPGQQWVRCPGCDTHHDVTARRGFLLAEARKVSVTVTEAVAALVGWALVDDDPKAAARLGQSIRTWASRKRLTQCGTTIVDGRERSLYRLGDIEDLLAKQQRNTSRTGS